MNKEPNMETSKAAEKDDEVISDESLLAYINDTPPLMSLLYDIDMLPEQITDREGNQWGRMMNIVIHWRENNLQLAAAPEAAQHIRRDLWASPDLLGITAVQPAAQQEATHGLVYDKRSFLTAHPSIAAGVAQGEHEANGWRSSLQTWYKHQGCEGCWRVEYNDTGFYAECSLCEEKRNIDSTFPLFPQPASSGFAQGALIPKDSVEWVVNDIAELGVKLGNQFFFCYKGHSLVYGSGEDTSKDGIAMHDEGFPMHWRPVGKREFGECIHPVNYKDLTKIGTVDLSDSDEWKQLPAATVRQPAAEPAKQGEKK